MMGSAEETDTWHTVDGTDLRVRCIGDEIQLEVFTGRGTRLRKTYDRTVALDLAKALVDADEHGPQSTARVRADDEQ